MNPQEAARYDAARIRAEMEIARTRQVDPNFRPQPSLTSPTVQGVIARYEGMAEDAIAHRFGRIGHNSGVPPLLHGRAETMSPAGRPLGTQRRGSTDRAYGLSAQEFRQVLTEIHYGARILPSPTNYRGYWIELSDRCVAGIRWSADFGTTVDVIRSSQPIRLPNRTKFHVRTK